MPKKIESSKKAPAAKAIEKPAAPKKAKATKPVAIVPAAAPAIAKPAKVTKKASAAPAPAAVVAKAVVKKAAAPKKVATAAPKTAPITSEDIALRAYFISERRQREGQPGDSAGDWIAAERELVAERAAAAKAAKAK